MCRQIRFMCRQITLVLESGEVNAHSNDTGSHVCDYVEHKRFRSDVIFGNIFSFSVVCLAHSIQTMHWPYAVFTDAAQCPAFFDPHLQAGTGSATFLHQHMAERQDTDAWWPCQNFSHSGVIRPTNIQLMQFMRQHVISKMPAANSHSVPNLRYLVLLNC